MGKHSPVEITHKTSDYEKASDLIHLWKIDLDFYKVKQNTTRQLQPLCLQLFHYISSSHYADWRVIAADGRIGRNSSADELVESPGPDYLKVEGMFKGSWGLWVEPDLEYHLTASWHNPAKCCQTKCIEAHTQTSSTNNKLKNTNEHQWFCSTSYIWLRFCSKFAWCSSWSVSSGWKEACERDPRRSGPCAFVLAEVCFLLLWISRPVLSLSFATALSLMVALPWLLEPAASSFTKTADKQCSDLKI